MFFSGLAIWSAPRARAFRAARLEIRSAFVRLTLNSDFRPAPLRKIGTRTLQMPLASRYIIRGVMNFYLQIWDMKMLTQDSGPTTDIKDVLRLE